MNDDNIALTEISANWSKESRAYPGAVARRLAEAIDRARQCKGMANDNSLPADAAWVIGPLGEHLPRVVRWCDIISFLLDDVDITGPWPNTYRTSAVRMSCGWLREIFTLAGIPIPLFLSASPAPLSRDMPIHEARSEKLLEWLEQEGIPVEKRHPLKGWTLRAIYGQLSKYPEFRGITFKTFHRHFWLEQEICKLPNRANKGDN